MTATNYVVTVQKPTAVSAVATGYFTSPTEWNLIVAKNTHLEIYLIDTEGIKLVKDVDIYGRINTLKTFRFQNMDKEMIFLLTDKYHGMILDCRKNEQNQYEILTKCHRLLKDAARSTVHAPLCSVDMKHQLILLRLSDGIIKVLDLKDFSSKESQSKTLTSYDIKTVEPLIIDMQVLSGYSRPTFAVLYPPKPDVYMANHEPVHEFHIRVYQIDMTQCNLFRLSWSPTALISDAKFLVPLDSTEQETFNCLVIGENQIGLCRGNDPIVRIASPELEDVVTITGYCRMNDQYLITASGKLFALNLNSTDENREYSLDLLGHICLGNEIAYLKHNLTFIGSSYSDSQLIRILPEAQNDRRLELVETYTNVGPILDMSMLDFERQGRQLVTCSGKDKDGSLRFIRTGIGIHEYASMDLRNIKGIWALKINHNYDNHLVVALFDQTRLFQLQNDEVEEVELPAFDFQHQTLFCANVQSNQYLQITTYSIRLIGNRGQDLLVEWKKDNEEITVATSNLTQCLCAIGNELFYFEIGQGTMNQINHCKLPHNVACLDISPLNEQDQRTDLCVIGLWTQISVWVCRLPSLEALHKEALTTDTLPRSVAMIAFDSQAYVVISLADGPVVYYSLDSNQGLLYDRRKIPLGRKPTTLTTCQHTDVSSPTNYRRVLFACSDRPTVLSSLNGKLIFSAVNLREIVCMCSFHSEFYGPSLTLVTDVGVILGRIDELQKLHVRTLQLGESVHRIATVGEQKSFVILTQHDQSSENDTTLTFISQQAQQKITCSSKIPSIVQEKPNGIQNNIVLLDQETHEVRLTIMLYPCEEPLSVCEIKFNSDETSSYIAVGTVILPSSDTEPKDGRIILFRQENDQRMTMVSEKEVNNPPHQLVAFHGQLLAAIGNRIHLFQLSEDKSKLIEEFESYRGFVECLQLKVKDDFILFSDLMNSLTLLRRDGVQKKKFEQIAHNAHPVWSLACEFLDDDTFITSTDQGNLIMYRKNSESTKEQERNILNEYGSWHVGEYINVFKHGCLITPETLESNVSPQTYVLMGAVSGYIGLLLQLPPSLFTLLQSLQKVLGEYLPSVGQIEHALWRSFDSDTGSHSSSGFIDGDLIEHYLDLPKNIQSELIKNLRDTNGTELETTVEDLVKIIEDLSRLH